MPGATRHCVFGVCKSDSREALPGFNPTVKFFRFPKPCIAFRKLFSGFEKTSREGKAFVKKHVSVCSVCELVSKWVLKCIRQDGKFSSIADVSKHTYICSLHFPANTTAIDPRIHVPGQVLKPSKRSTRTSLRRLEGNDDSSLARVATLPTDENSHSIAHDDPTNEIMWQSSPPSIEFHETVTTSVEISQALTMMQPAHPEAQFILPSDVTEGEETSDQLNSPLLANMMTQTDERQIEAKRTQCLVIPQKCVQVQTFYSFEELQKMERDLAYYRSGYFEILSENRRLQDESDFGLLARFEEELKTDTRMCNYYCGFNYKQLSAIFEFVHEPVINHWGRITLSTRASERRLVSPMQEFILTMLRLRSGFQIVDMAHRFKVSVGFVSQTVTTWVLLMYQKFNSLRRLMFASREKIRENLPKRFSNMRNVRVIIDGAELFCQSPSDFSQQTNCYSQYKAHTTWKVLIGCTPTGAVSFVSDLFEGSITDRQLVIESGLVDLLEKGDSILADRGFTIEDLTGPRGIKLRIPAFLHGRKQLAPQEEMNTRIVARNRIFVEHTIRRMKEFKILDGIKPQSMRHVMSQIVFVSACLTNFQEPINN